MHWNHLFLFLFFLSNTVAFTTLQQNSCYQCRRCRQDEALLSSTTTTTSTLLRGFDEWREMELAITDNADYKIHGGTSSPLRPVSILPQKYTNVALPGETKYLQFVQPDELELFHMALEHHNGIFGMGLVSSDDVGVDRTMLATLPLLEIQEYNHNMGPELGIFCVARVVGKAKVHQVFWAHSDDASNQPFQALVYDTNDNFQKSEIMAANQVADGIELLVSYLARMETSSEEWDDDDDDTTTTLDQFMEAYNIALNSDSQEYEIPLEEVQNLGQRSWRELKAISWAAFACSKHEPQERLQALYSDSILRRLQLARNWLSGVRVPASSEQRV